MPWMRFRRTSPCLVLRKDRVCVDLWRLQEGELKMETSSVRMSLRASRQHAAEIRLPAEVNWEMLDKTRFFVLGAALFSGVSGILYPSMVLKTQQQVVPGNVSSARLAVGILRNQGIPGLYKGFSTSLMGTIPARALYMSTLEITKSAVGSGAARIGLSEPASAAVSNAVAGMSAAVAAQLVWTPVDVVSQRLMVQGAEGVRMSNYSGGFDAFKTIFRLDGLRGLYRGFGMSIITYAPSNAVWWASYSIAQRSMWKGVALCKGDDCSHASSGLVLGTQAASAACAGGISALVTTPLDTIKTRMQVLDCGSHRPRFSTTLKVLIAEGGWKACYKGLGPRWASMSLSATTMITTYEFLKRMSAKSQG